MSYIQVTTQAHVATLVIDRPKALNALNSEINADIMAAINEVKADPSVRVLIVTGSERAFAAGADVKEMAEATPRYAREFCGLAIDINNELESLPIPTIAAVGGFAFGGGCEMTLACDFRVGGSRTTLSFPEVGLGIIPGANGCARATAIVGPAKAKQLVMLTEMIPGKQAYDLGLLNWFVEGDAELDAKAKEAKRVLATDREVESEKFTFRTFLLSLGFIGEVKDLDIVRLPREGETIETTITVEQEIFDVTLVSAEVRVGTETIATTRLKIAQGSPLSQSLPQGGEA